MWVQNTPISYHTEGLVKTEAVSTTLFVTSISNNRKMRPLNYTIQNIRFYCKKPEEEKILNFQDGLLSFLLTSAGPSAQCGQIGRHCLADISKGLREIQFFSFLWLHTHIMDL